MFPFFIEPAYAAHLPAHEYIDLIVPASVQIAIALGILGTAIATLIATVRSINASKENKTEIAEVKKHAKEANEVAIKTAEMAENAAKVTHDLVNHRVDELKEELKKSQISAIKAGIEDGIERREKT